MEGSDLYTTRFDRRVVSLLEEYAAFNPHATFHYTYEREPLTWEATDTTWQKWRPCDRTSPHWYTADRLRSLIAAYLTDDESTGKTKTLRAFVAEFCGLRRSDQQKLVIDAMGMSGACLRDLVEGHDLAMPLVEALLTAMQREAKPVKPSALGIIGETSVRQRLLRSFPLAPESVKYKRVAGEVDGCPFVLEVACGWNAETEDRGRRVMVGINWTPALSSPFSTLLSILGEARVDRGDDVVIWVHLATPRPDFTDRGKSQLSLPLEIKESLSRAVRLVTKVWTGMKLDADRQQRVTDRQREFALQSQRRERISVKDAAYRVMEQSYRETAGRLNVANARQVMYVARPLIIELTGKTRPWKQSSRFTQHLLPDFIAEQPDLTSTWDVVWDDRGHFTEPHTKHQIGIGGIAVRRYIDSWEHQISHVVPWLHIPHEMETSGPANRFQYVLFIEKEGFMLHLDAARLAQRFDVAIMSTKGMTVTAARHLVAELSRRGVTILVVHDFDKSGFSILHTMRTDTRRYKFLKPPNVIDLGLRLDDAQAMGLDSEEVDYPKAKVDPRVNLRASGATEKECAFLVQQDRPPWRGRRVELNAMSTDVFIEWLEGKLLAQGVRKVVPDAENLANAYRHMLWVHHAQESVDKALDQTDKAQQHPIPLGLESHLRWELERDGKAPEERSDEPWDEALWRVVCEQPSFGITSDDARCW